MNHTVLKQTVIPSWVIKALITAIIGVAITGVAAMASRLSTEGHNHESRISVLEDHTKGVDKSLDEIKTEQHEQSRKLDRLLARRQ